MAFARGPASGAGGGGQPFTGVSRPPAPTIFIGNIPYDLTETQLVEIFQEVGPVKSLRLVSDRETGKAKGYGFCEYYDVATAEGAVRNLNGHEVHGRQLRVDFADEHIARGSRDKESNSNAQAQQAPPSTKGIGEGAVKTSACQMSFLLGGAGAVLSDTPPLGGSNEKLYDVLSSMSRAELFEVLSSMKSLMQNNYGHARQVLIQNPQLARSLFQIEIMLGLVDAPNLPNATLPSREGGPMPPIKMEPEDMQDVTMGGIPGMQSPEPMQRGDGMMPGAPNPTMQGDVQMQGAMGRSEFPYMDANSQRGIPENFQNLTVNGGDGTSPPVIPMAPQASIPMANTQIPGQQMQATPQQILTQPPHPMMPQQPMIPTAMMQPVMQVPGSQIPQAVMPGQMGIPEMTNANTPPAFTPVESSQNVLGAGGFAGAMQQQNLVEASGLRGEGMAVGGASAAGGVIGDGSLGSAAGLGNSGIGGQSGVNLLAGFGMVGGQGGDVQAQPGLDGQSKALLEQVMSLTPEQIGMLPAEQRDQVLALQQQLRLFQG